MADRSYHHGNLRAELLSQAAHTLREAGVDQLSLRELARRAGVSSAAPRRHFADRQELLDALVDTGFARLADEIGVAIQDAEPESPARLQAVASAYLRFAIRDGSLLDLMFATKTGKRQSTPPEGATRLFTAVGDVIGRGQREGVLPPGDPERLRLLLVATVQGVAALVTSGRIPLESSDVLVADAIALFTRSPQC